MSKPSLEELKRQIFESMSAKRRKQIEKRGYDNWDPFIKPKEPPFYSEVDTEGGLPENPLELYHYYMRQYLKEHPQASDQYRQGIMEACQSIKIHEERLKAHHDFYAWYHAQKAAHKAPG